MEMINGNIYEHCGKKYQSYYLPMGGNPCISCAFHDGNFGCDFDPDECHTLLGRLGYFKLYNEENKMTKRKFIVKFKTHDENELVEATCSAHAAILAQSRRIEMGEDDVTVKSVEPINSYVVTVDNYTITNNNGIISVTRNGEFWVRSPTGGGLVLALVQRIEELEIKTKEQKRDEEFIKRILNHTYEFSGLKKIMSLKHRGIYENNFM